MNFKIRTDDRKAFVKMLADLTGEQSNYLGMPTRSYRVGCYTIDPECVITFERDEKDIIPTLKQKGFIDSDLEVSEGAALRESDQAAEPEAQSETAFPMKLDISLPLSNHSAESIRQLLYFIYGREELFNKVLNGTFHVNDEFLTALADNTNVLDITNLMSAKEAFENEHGTAFTGILITEDKLTFTGFGEIGSAEEADAYRAFAVKMNEYAISSRRILPKKIKRTESEKYDMRNILVRIGLGGSEYKEARRVILKGLTGASAFPNTEKYEKWKALQNNKRAAKQAVSTETDTQDEDSETVE